MNAPEKIYIDANEDWHRTYTAFTEKAKGDDIEYTRTDAFIEKACERLTLNIRMLLKVLDVEYNTHEIDVKDFIEDFRRAMEDEI